MKEKQPIGYEITDKLRKKLEEEPDSLIIFNDKSYHLGYGENKTKGLKHVMAYCLIKKEGKIIGEIISGATDKVSAQRGLGIDIYKLIKMSEEDK